MKLTIKQSFPYFHAGINRRDYEAGQEVDVDDQEMIEVAIREGWAIEKAEEKTTRQPRVRKAAQEKE